MVLSFEERARSAHHPLARRILETAVRKRSNLCLSADVTSAKTLIELVNQAGPFVCAVKTHLDIVRDFEDGLIEQLLALKKRHDFVLFEDRKFADIGATVAKQYAGGIFRISSWADLVTVHSLPGDGVIAGLRNEVSPGDERGALLLAEMSSAGHLLTSGYLQSTLAMARRNRDFVIGFIAGRRVAEEDENFIIFTPGISLESKGDLLGQQYRTPKESIASGTDIMIVGRGIISANDTAAEAKKYREAGWSAYLVRQESRPAKQE